VHHTVESISLLVAVYCAVSACSGRTTRIGLVVSAVLVVLSVMNGLSAYRVGAGAFFVCANAIEAACWSICVVVGLVRELK
jgi:hypothetical protein